MDHITAYRQKTSELITEVNDISGELTENINKINILNEHFSKLFELFKRGSELSRILQEYFLSLEQDTKRLKETYVQQQKSLTAIGRFVDETNAMLISLRDSIEKIKEMSGLFIKSARLLGNLAKNTEIKAYEAQDEGKGLAVIAQEALKLARMAQDPLQDLSSRLGNLENIAQPAVEELDPMISLARSSPELISNCISILSTIDRSSTTVQMMIGRIDQTSSMNTQLSNVIGEEISRLTAQLSLTLNSIDIMSLHCSQICKLADELADTEQMINLLETRQDNRPDEKDYLAIKKNFFINNFNFIRRENVERLASFRIDKEPPILSHAIQENIKDITAQTEDLGKIGNELIDSKEELGGRIEAIIESSSKIDGFIGETVRIRERLINVARKLSEELVRIEDRINATNRICVRIRTLGLFARIEESRSVRHRSVIAPVVESFFTRQMDIERAMAGILPEVQRIHEIINYFRNTRVPFPESKIQSPDFSRLKLFIDDIHRVFGEEIDQTREINELAGIVSAEKEKLQKEWADLAATLSSIQEIQEMITERPVLPVRFGIAHKPDIVAVNLSNDPITFRPDQRSDIISTQVINCYCTGLFEFSDSVEALPALCSKYSISPDGRQYDFSIRPDIKFQNGRPVGIEDIKQGIIRALSSSNFNLFEMIQGSEDFIETKDARNLGISILDRSTLRVELSYPFIPLISNFATNVADPVIDKDLPISTGPYELVGYEPGKKIVLRANQYYYKGRPAVDEIHFLIEENEEKCYDLFRKGELHVYRPSNITLARLRKESPRSIQTLPELSVQYICINCRKKPFDHKLVRQAICHAVNIQEIIDSSMKDDAVPAKGLFPPSMKTYNSKLTGYRHNPDRACELLKKAGYPNGLPDTYLFDTSDNAPALQRAQIVKENLARIGIKIRINPMSFSQLIDKSFEGKSILSFRGWISDNGDPDNFVYPLFHSSSYGRTGNTFFFSTPELDKDIDNARRIHNLIQRNMLYQKIESNILEEAPAVFLYHRLLNLAVNENIRGLKPHPLNLFKLRPIWSGSRNSAHQPILAGARE